MLTSPRARLAALAAALVALMAWSGFVSGLRHSSASAFASWAGTMAGVAAIDTAMWRFAGGRPAGASGTYTTEGEGPASSSGAQAARAGRLAAYFPWVVVALAAVAWEALGIDTGRRTPHLTVSALALAFRPLEAALFLVWVLSGLAYGLARARARAQARTSSPASATSALRQPRGSAGSVRRGTPGLCVLVGSRRLVALLLPASRAAGVAFWVAWLCALALLDAAARLSGHRFADAEQLIVAVSRPMAARVALIGAWAYAGWHLFAH